MESNITQGTTIFNELQAIQALMITFGYDFSELSLDDVFSLRREFKKVIDAKLEEPSDDELYEKAGGSGLSEQVYKDDCLIDYDSSY